MKKELLLKTAFLFFLISFLLNIGNVKAYHIFPEGVPTTTYLVKEDDTLWSVFQGDWITVAKINRVSPDSLVPGMILLVPIDMEKASGYSPLPHQLPYQTNENKVVLVDLELQVLGKYEKGELIQWMPISSGKENHLTPKGVFWIYQKELDHYSNTRPKPEGGAPMPYALRYNGPYWIHQGPLPGHPDSYGCVRLMEMDAAILYWWADIKTKVIIE